MAGEFRGWVLALLCKKVAIEVMEAYNLQQSLVLVQVIVSSNLQDFAIRVHSISCAVPN
ncbi:hypothetical protein AAC978_01920 [Desulfitobacterium sp. THU1]